MKKSKLLIPLITIAGTAAVAAPVVCLTSCGASEKEEEHFTFNETESDKKAIEEESPYIVGQADYVFDCKDETLTEEAVKLIEPVVSITKTNSYITVLRCWKQTYDLTAKTITVTVSYSIDPSAFTYKEEDPEKLEFSMVIHNGTWTQSTTGFSITAKRDAKPE